MLQVQDATILDVRIWSLVLVVQSLLFADGGVSALGTNITNMALIGVAAAYGTALGMAALLRRGRPVLSARRLGAVAFVAAVIGTLAAATGFIIEYSIGGAATTSLSAVTGYMLGTHLLIGIGEGVITAATVMAVAGARPDLVYLLRGERAEAAAVPA